jgi:hypothetical protein
MSLSHWGMFDAKIVAYALWPLVWANSVDTQFELSGPLSIWGIEGPTYADRVKGRLTFHDWNSWDEGDKVEWLPEKQRRVRNA